MSTNSKKRWKWRFVHYDPKTKQITTEAILRTKPVTEKEFKKLFKRQLAEKGPDVCWEMVR